MQVFTGYACWPQRQVLKQAGRGGTRAIECPGSSSDVMLECYKSVDIGRTRACTQTRMHGLIALSMC